MKRALLLATILLTAPSFAAAHVSVRPRESKAGAEERYTVRVPTEGAVATTHVRLEIPANVTVLELLPADGATFETLKDGERVTAITWKKEIPPKQAAEFVLLARNPAASEIVWKAHQHFADGTTADVDRGRWRATAGGGDEAGCRVCTGDEPARGQRDSRDPVLAGGLRRRVQREGPGEARHGLGDPAFAHIQPAAPTRRRVARCGGGFESRMD